ncbi:hypothetical protein HYY69_04865 [Candidatus Woesearchaeota archaeon]|nr:hypothetical protein [Candidatus Woesearchaeota archaeon]
MKNIINLKDQTYNMWPFKNNLYQQRFATIAIFTGFALIAIYFVKQSFDLLYIGGIIFGCLGLIYAFEGTKDV